MTTTLEQDTGTDNEQAVAELADRLFGAALGAAELFTAYLGDRLGLYRSLHDFGPATAAQLAQRTGINDRYAREWVVAQSISGFLTVDGTDPATARFALADGVSAVLVQPTSPAFLGGLPRALAAVGGVLPTLVRAYRTGDPVTYPEYGPDAVAAQSALNRPAFVNDLVSDWLPQIPDVAARLRDTEDPAVVGDLGCGPGWSAIALAEAFPHLRVIGVDNDEASVALARRNAVEHNVADRVEITVADLCAPAGLDRRFDVVFLFECLHDLPRPVVALRNAAAAVRPGGSIVVMDERVAEQFTAPGDPIERFFATTSALWCVPQGLVGADPDPVGPLLRPETVHALATEAGITTVDVLPIEHPFWRFYRLVP